MKQLGPEVLRLLVTSDLAALGWKFHPVSVGMTRRPFLKRHPASVEAHE